MKLRCLTSLVATMVMAGTAGAAEIYNKNGNILNVFGSLVGGYCFSKDNANKDGSHSFVRYGFFGKSYVEDRMVGFGMWEHEVSLQNIEGVGGYKSSNNNMLLGYAGIKCGNLGVLDYGRNYGVLYDVGSWTDVVPAFGGDLFIADNFLSSRGSNIITYRNNNFFGCVEGLDFAVQYQGKNDVNLVTGRTLKTANGEGYGISASYTIDNVAAAVAYANSKRTLDQINLDNDVYKNDNAEAYYCGLKYNGYGMYLAAIYGETYNMIPFGNFDDNLNPDSIYGFVDKSRNVAVVAQYQFNFGLRPSISYVHAKSNGMDRDSYGNYLKKSVTLGASYIYNANISTTMDYRVNLLNKSDFTSAAQIDTNDVIALGIVYAF